jgi:hypothetical protein
LDRAKALIAAGDERSLVYAALELRQLLELVTYQKLDAYEKWLPASVLGTWQPPQAMRALLQFEPGADQNMSLRFAVQGPTGERAGPWVEMGEHKAIGAKWLTKQYNKLGSYVHVARDDHRTRGVGELRAYLDEVAAELEAVADSHLLACSMAERVTFSCAACEQEVTANAEALRESGRAVCFNLDCGAAHVVEEIDGQWSFKLDSVDANCLHCGTIFCFAKCHAKPGAVLTCPECGARHDITLGWRLADTPAGDRAS